MNKQESVLTKGQEALLWLGTGIILLLLLTLLAIYFSRFSGRLGDQETFAHFGDFIGGTTAAVLGFATVLLLIWSLHVQLRELQKTTSAAENQVEETRSHTEAILKSFETEVKKAKTLEERKIVEHSFENLNRVLEREIFSNKSVQESFYMPLNALKETAYQIQTLSKKQNNFIEPYKRIFLNSLENYALLLLPDRFSSLGIYFADHHFQMLKTIILQVRRLSLLEEQEVSYFVSNMQLSIQDEHIREVYANMIETWELQLDEFEYHISEEGLEKWAKEKFE